MCVFGVEGIELSDEFPQLRSDLSLIGDVAERAGDEGEPSVCWLVDVEQVGKGIPACVQ